MAARKSPKSILFVVNNAQYFLLHRLSLARAVQQAGYRVMVATSPDSQQHEIEAIEAEGFRFFPFYYRPGMRSPLRDIGSLLHLVWLYRKLQPDIVHHLSIKIILYGTLAARIAGVPAIVNALTGLGYVFMPGSPKRAILRWMIETAYRHLFAAHHIRVLFQNPDDRQLLVDRGVVAADQAVLIYGSGVDTERFIPRPEPDGEPVVLHASRMLWDKGIQELVEAARLLKQRGVAGTVVLAGAPDPNNPSSIPEETLVRWTEQGLVQWVGYTRDMPGRIASAHVVCLPSSYREGVPMTLLEAAATGRPLVTTDMPGCREVVTHGWNGFLVPVRNPQALANALQLLLTNPTLRKTMGARSRTMACQKFDKDIVIRETIAVYRSLENYLYLLDEVAQT